MGCDGGTIPRRDELVRTKKKPEQKDKNAETVAKWKHCAISQDPLRKPIVACELGKLYNKEAVLEHLLNKEKGTTEVAGHIMKLSDVKELNLTEKPGFAAKSNQKGDEYVDFHDSRYICPVTGLEMNGKQRFYIIWKCGCIVSERAIKEVKSETCHKCGKPFDEKDVIILNGTDEEIESLRERMVARRRLAKLEKRKKKTASSYDTTLGKKIKLENGESSVTASTVECKNVKVEPNESLATAYSSSIDDKIKIEPGTSNGSILGMSSIDKKVKIEPGTSNGSILSGPAPVKSTIGVKKNDKVENGKMSAKSFELPEKARKSYSIAKDPSASAAYKSLFTSHTSAKKQDKAHWITHNPLYY